ncbi:MAG: alanine--tRNA ligase, partial [Candidatus Paceibacterota bacterium]
MNSKELRSLFLNYFKENGHKVVPSSSLIPEDNTVLFTTAGMQQFSPYVSSKKDVLKDFQSRHLCSCQKCFRTGDIEEIGDDTHHTFFEMLGNWSIGQDEAGYFKEGAIEYALDFLINKLGLEKEKLHITIFKGNAHIPKDESAIKIWKKHGINHIYEFGEQDNFWGPVSNEGPCGPCSEIHYDRGKEYGCSDCGPNCDYCKRFVEIWNLVFMEYYKKADGSFEKLKQTNIDTGIGFERLLSILNKKNSAYETDLFLDLIKEIEKYSTFKYSENKVAYRIIADHLRGASFLIGENIVPSNNDRGYILRRLLRRIIRYARIIELDLNYVEPLFFLILSKYGSIYKELNENNLLHVFNAERQKFEKSLEKGLKEIEKLSEISPKQAFFLYQTFGFPIEMIKEEAQKKGIQINEKGFQKELEKHQEISRKGFEKKFQGGSLEETRLHTLTHLMHQALRDVLGDHVQQMGSSINKERLRFDFSHPQKLTKEELEKVENLVNQRIKAGFEVVKEVRPLEEALKSGA